MANIMLRRDANGGLIFYLPKKDLEDTVLSLESEDPQHWGGRLELAGGGSYYIEPMPAPPRFPISLRAKRLEGQDD